MSGLSGEGPNHSSDWLCLLGAFLLCVAAWLLVCGMCVDSLGFDASFGVVAVSVAVGDA